MKKRIIFSSVPIELFLLCLFVLWVTVVADRPILPINRRLCDVLALT